jgi:polyferredoxin
MKKLIDIQPLPKPRKGLSTPIAARKREGRRLQRLRLAIQVAFALLCIWIGVEFHFFVGYLESAGTTTLVERPPGVEGFLPISSLMSLYYFALTGTIHSFHPAGMVIFAAIVLMSLIFAKSFCAWLCPVGLISETLGDLGEKIFGRRLSMPRWLDYPLRSLKYIILGFFVWAIFFAMDTVALGAFLDSPYNLMADIKMYYFFAHISRFSLIVIGSLMLLSVVIRGFWCRYLCPYGALLGLIGLVSPARVTRDRQTCIDCGKCARACPSRIAVNKITRVRSDECTSCLNCVASCPVSNCLEVHLPTKRHRVAPKAVAAVVVAIFVGMTGIAMLAGYWHNDIPKAMYLQLFDIVHQLDHPRGASDINELNAQTGNTDNHDSELHNIISMERNSP